ncbi:DUF4332 domain-containing protein [Aureliella helgolandensis]|uniref:Zinc dependent phospholipase C n=1 Tax=Aureliella helgolandensis TaxID=2527968 RepID=A0A518G617_9BACT|nr:DUF4332 domain-containing protein [Aureliella helgolandensis]QDV24032.1 Zinc dependent phospholipase C [Aureliella helgolandensis]
MSPIVSILRATHCRSTHHYFAIDAIQNLATPSGQRLANILLKYHDDYLVGAKAPDKSFRDFQNHVLHVQDGYWGGATAACEEWLEKTIGYLNRRKWKKAAYACGVLSHYFTDPLMPLHTAQSEREAIVHRPMEWSICKSYDAIHAQCGPQHMEIDFQLASGEGWISKAVTAGAEIANQHYARLIEIYDLELGCQHPPDGLNHEARQILAELFGIALTGWGSVVTRIADEIEVELPESSLALTTLLASVDMPLAWIVGRVSDAAEQRAVAALFKEYSAKGTLKRHRPPEIKKVAKERAKSPARPSTGPLTSQQPAGGLQVAVDEGSRPEGASWQEAGTRARDLFETIGATHTTAAVQTAEPPLQAAPTLVSLSASRESFARPLARSEPFVVANSSTGVVAVEQPPAQTVSSPFTSAARVSAPVQASLNAASPIVDAPSIGPKTAARFERVGIATVGQFLQASHVELEQQLNTRWITQSLLAEWRDQALLVCDVPALCGYRAQLLVAADCRSVAMLRQSKAAELAQRIDLVCNSIDGQRILRGSPPPTRNDIANWILSAQDSQARAA